MGKDSVPGATETLDDGKGGDLKIGSINLSKIDKAQFYVGKDGTKYMNIAIIENRNGPDQYGNDGMITQSVSKEDRLKGVKGPIIGNWRRIESKDKAAAKTAPKAKSAPLKMDSDDGEGSTVPF
jgi:hypothetical protein